MSAGDEPQKESGSQFQDYNWTNLSAQVCAYCSDLDHIKANILTNLSDEEFDNLLVGLKASRKAWKVDKAYKERHGEDLTITFLDHREIQMAQDDPDMRNFENRLEVKLKTPPRVPYKGQGEVRVVLFERRNTCWSIGMFTSLINLRIKTSTAEKEYRWTRDGLNKCKIEDMFLGGLVEEVVNNYGGQLPDNFSIGGILNNHNRSGSYYGNQPTPFVSEIITREKLTEVVKFMIYHLEFGEAFMQKEQTGLVVVGTQKKEKSLYEETETGEGTCFIPPWDREGRNKSSMIFMP